MAFTRACLIAILAIASWFPASAAFGQTPTKYGIEARVNSASPWSQDQPAIVALETGGFVVVWSGIVEGQPHVFFQRYASNGAKVGSYGVVTSGLELGNSGIQPAVAALPGGGFVVVWVSVGPRGQFNPFAQRFDVNGQAIGARVYCDFASEGQQHSPAVVVFGDGRFLLHWAHERRISLLSDGIYGRLFAANGSVLFAEVVIARGNTWAGSPSAIAIGNDTAIVTWSARGGDGTHDIFAQRMNSSGAKVGYRARVAITTDRTEMTPHAARLSGGKYVVVWDDFTLLRPTAQVFNADGTRQGGNFPVGQNHAAVPAWPRVTGLADGGFVVAWVDTVLQPTPTMHIKGQRFSSTRQRLGSEFGIKEMVNWDYPQPALATLANGRFVIAWDIVKDASTARKEIYRQLYNVP